MKMDVCIDYPNFIKFSQGSSRDFIIACIIAVPQFYKKEIFFKYNILEYRNNKFTQKVFENQY